jgi:hypothetical protein
MGRRGHDTFVTARAKEFSVELLERYGIPYRLLSEQRAGRLGLATEMARRTWRLGRAIGEFQPDVLTGIMGPSIAIGGALRRIPAVVFYDTEFAVQTNWFAYPLAHSVCTPDCYEGRVRGKHFTYPGYHELAYLHPRRFTPRAKRLTGFGLSEAETYFLVRFVFWQAAHDRRERGLSVEQKRALVDLLERSGRVMISSEGPLPADLETRRIRGPITDIHHLLAYAQLVVGESATMSSEAAVLGVPAVFIATTGRGYTADQEKRYGLVKHFTEDRFGEALAAVQELVDAGSTREFGSRARERLLEEKIDVTEWMVDFFEERFGP